MMEVKVIFYSVLCLTILGSGASWLLTYAQKKLCIKEEEKNELVSKVQEVLPGVNCGACGFSSCLAFAKAVVKGQAKCDGCRVGRDKVAKQIKEILG
ncbi:MAG: Fe-S protein [Candidatus Omnitrophota bacterium]|nr:MAG: Fe-S protein [Candidatus Omnitrophota bacterium]